MLSRSRQNTLTGVSFAYDSNNRKMETIVDVWYEMLHCNAREKKKRKSKVGIDVVVFRGSSGLKHKPKCKIYSTPRSMQRKWRLLVLYHT